jgi:hypothetical protein
VSKRNDKQAAGKRRDERPIFEAIRKPVAPPGRVLGQAKPEERAHPAERKIKHKHRPGDVEE